MASTRIHLKIVTPEKVVYQNDVHQVTVPTASGEITILPHHIALVSVLAAGELVAIDTEPVNLAISGGFIQVNDNQVTVLADTAERAEEIDEARAEEGRQRAQRLLEEAKNKADVDYAGVAAKLEKELARLRVAKKRRSKR